MEHVPSSEVFLLPDSQQAGRMGDMGQFPAPVQDVQIPDANLQSLNSPFRSSTKKKGGYIFWRGLAFLEDFQTSEKWWLVGLGGTGLGILSKMTSPSVAGFHGRFRTSPLREPPGFRNTTMPGFRMALPLSVAQRIGWSDQATTHRRFRGSEKNSQFEKQKFIYQK